MKPAARLPEGLAARLLDALPQTQCTRCGYPDCAGYAQAIANGEADINQCPPGGQEGVARLAALTGTVSQALNPAFGLEAPRMVALIDENWCIGCTLCIPACPTDAIVGSNKRMHTIIEAYCTGCGLCVPACPVDCIALENASGSATGWAAWSSAAADTARQRHAAAIARHQRDAAEHAARLAKKTHTTLANLAAHAQHTDPVVLDKKRSVIEAALERARAKRQAQEPN